MQILVLIKRSSPQTPVLLERGFSVQDEMLGKIYHQVCEKANECIVCVSSDKYNKNAYSNFGSITSADIIVTDESAPENYIKEFFENNIRVYNTYNIKHI